MSLTAELHPNQQLWQDNSSSAQQQNTDLVADIKTSTEMFSITPVNRLEISQVGKHAEQSRKQEDGPQLTRAHSFLPDKDSFVP